MQAIAKSDATAAFSEQQLPAEIRGAVICCNGKLTPNFDYIFELRKANDHAAALRRASKSMKSLLPAAAARVESVALELTGHLFDTGALNSLMNIIEDTDGASAKFDFANMIVGETRDVPTRLRMKLIAAPEGGGSALLDQLVKFASDNGIAVRVKGGALSPSGGGALSPPLSPAPAADAANPCGAAVVPATAATRRQRPRQRPWLSSRRILVLGSGFVAPPLVEYLLRARENHITLVSVLPGEAAALAAGRGRVTPMTLDVSKVG